MQSNETCMAGVCPTEPGCDVDKINAAAEADFKARSDIEAPDNDLDEFTELDEMYQDDDCDSRSLMSVRAADLTASYVNTIKALREVLPEGTTTDDLLKVAHSILMMAHGKTKIGCWHGNTGNRWPTRPRT